MTSIRNLLFLSFIQFSLYLSVFGQDTCSHASSPAFKRICQLFQLHNNRAQHNEQPIVPQTTAAPIPEWCKDGGCGGAGGPGGGTPPTDNLIGVNPQDYMEPSVIVECQDLVCLCNFLGILEDDNTCTLPNETFLRKAIRKEYRTLSDDERTRFHNAINKLKSSKVDLTTITSFRCNTNFTRDYLKNYNDSEHAVKTDTAPNFMNFPDIYKLWQLFSDYDHFHALHYHYSYGSGAHGGPAFALWHREFIKRLEFALREIDPTIALPYWDVTMDQILPDPKDSIMWTADFMGSVDSNGNVNSGPLADWTTLEVINKMEYSDRQIFEQTVPLQKLGKKRIIRKLGYDFGNSLFADINITNILTNDSIYLIFGDSSVENCSFLNWLGIEDGIQWREKTLEGIHGLVHIYVGGKGGDMGEFQTAVGDPVFFLLHSFVDLIFELWRQIHQSRYERENIYREPNSSCHISEHYLDTNMRPFLYEGAYMKNRDGLSNKYTDLFYEYEPRPRCHVKNCGSKYLFCDNSKDEQHCGVKIKVGGNCSGLLDSDNPCYNGWCRNIDDGKPCVQCRRGSCVARESSTGQTSPRQRNPPFLNQTRNNTSNPPYRTTPRPYTIPDRVTNVPSINVNNRYNNVHGPNRSVSFQNNGCHDANLCCSYWAQQGRCPNNPSWMSRNCQLSCGYCNVAINYREALGCYDSRKECFEWSRHGHCLINPKYMLKYCKQSCRVCLSLVELKLSCK